MKVVPGTRFHSLADNSLGGAWDNIGVGAARVSQKNSHRRQIYLRVIYTLGQSGQTDRSVTRSATASTMRQKWVTMGYV